MPLLKISSNKNIIKQEQEAFLKEASHLLAKTLNKKEAFVMTLFAPPMPMTFGGDNLPGAYLEIKSLGLTPDQTLALSSAFCQLVEERLGILQSRVYIEFSNPERPYWGWNGRTF